MKNRTLQCLSVMMLMSLLTALAGAQDTQTYRPGGPLAGVELELYPTQPLAAGQQGLPGFPGSNPEMAAREQQEDPESTRFTPQGQFPKELPYEGSVEHYSSYWAHYLPMRTMFDRQSLLENWRATQLPQAAGRVESYAEPVYWIPRHGAAVHTGQHNAPVEVVRATVDGPVFRLDAGELDPGLYVVRAIGAVETEHLERQRLPLYMVMTVNDGVEGETTTYRMRFPYVDEFYSVAEFHFHAPQRRRYEITLAVDERSEVDLLIYNIDLHDVLAGMEIRPIKNRRTLTAGREVVDTPVANTLERLEQEAALWMAFPPLNSHSRFTYGMGGDDARSNWPNIGAGGLTAEEIAEQYGTWDWRRAQGDVLAINEKLGLVYTLSDFRAGKPLPDPYPFKDRGMGVWTPAATADENPQNFWPVPEALGRRMRGYAGTIDTLTKRYLDRGDVEAGREAAFRLVRVAYNAPAIVARLSPHAFLVQPGPYGRDLGSRRRSPNTGAEINAMALLPSYDALFDLISKDQGLADSINRFIPWVQTPQDVIALLDAYLVQMSAKRLMRYHAYSSNTPHQLLTPVNVLGDNDFTYPWMQWLFSSAFIYPLQPAGIQDLMITANDRNGIGYIGSTMYAQGQTAIRVAEYMDEYLALGGLPEFDLSDLQRFAKPVAATHWMYDVITAGGWFLPMGSVTGPDKGFGHAVTKAVPQGWRWTKDPRFAWGLVHHGERAQFSDEEWAEIEQAAATVERAPWLENPSRVLINWAGLLESGLAFDDPRYRRSVMVRIGSGWGHHHHDSLDLQIKGLGYSMTIDGGQRPGYGIPSDRSSLTHNLVTIDDKEWMGHSWVNALSHVEEASYLRAQAQPPASHPDVRLYARQVALIDVDQGAATEGVIPPSRTFSLDDPPANSYVFDVQRVAGGQIHTHGLHAMIEDELVTNTLEIIDPGDLPPQDLGFADRFPRHREDYPRSQAAFAGKAPQVLQATWRMIRERQGIARTEESQHAAIWNPDSPRKYLRMHLLGQEGERVVSAWNYCRQWSYGWTAVHTRRHGEDLESLFTAILEPYAGEPVISDLRELAVADNEQDALRAVAVQVQTVRGATDVLFADGRPATVRRVGEDMVFAGEFAFVSELDGALRLATLTGGTRLEHPRVSLLPATAQYEGRIIASDYGARTFIVDQAWDGAPLMAGRVFEVGVPGRMTTYTIAHAQPTEHGTAVTVTEAAEFYQSRVFEVDVQEQIVVCALGFSQNERAPMPGIDKHWVAMTEDGRHQWRAEYLGDTDGSGRYRFRMDGPVHADQFADNQGLILREYGVGDTVRLSTFTALRQVQAGVYALSADTAVQIHWPAATAIEMQGADGAWQPVTTTARDGGLNMQVSAEQLAGGPLLLRVR